MSTQSSYKMNDKLGVIMILIAATGMAMVGTFSRGATKGLLPGSKAVIGFVLVLRSYDHRDVWLPAHRDHYRKIP